MTSFRELWDLFKSTKDDLARERLNKFITGENIPVGKRIVVLGKRKSGAMQLPLTRPNTSPNSGRHDRWM